MQWLRLNSSQQLFPKLKFLIGFVQNVYLIERSRLNPYFLIFSQIYDIFFHFKQHKILKTLVCISEVVKVYLESHKTFYQFSVFINTSEQQF